ncbi:MAG TPA: glycine--tRNA ligase subunit beta [Caulobacteraceae bacterium]|nr:glycine--tRNA ligase subunit beta [Caulobacteraceae bacterium]
MPSLLLEIFSEEIPARMQGGAARDLERLFAERFREAGLAHESLRTFAGPRRLTLVVDGLPAAQADRVEERKGPRANAPEQALQGFLRSTGLTREQLEERDGVLFARIERPGRPTGDVIWEITWPVLLGFPWPKSMRWGPMMTWVRPVKRIVCVFDGKIVQGGLGGVAGIEFSNVTQGHRFMGSGEPFSVTGFEDYRRKLAENFVVLEAAERKARILERARAVCAEAGLELVEDEGLLEEVGGLAEWPVPILGDMDPAFLDLPPEVIRTSMRTHQKYFAVRDPNTGRLAPRFVAVANIEASDGGAAIAAGNARVLSARLNDARFFWDEDLKAGFEPWLEKLKGVTFHAKLGTVAERVERIAALAREIAPLVGADPDTAAEAARLCKADLASGMVGEFPELQGVMGGYYARAKGLAPEIADAIRDHYKPQGPGDTVPTAPVTVAVALADKLDTLVGFFAIDEKPTGSKDPYALRRAALGVIRTVLEGGLRIPLREQLASAFALLSVKTWGRPIARLSDLEVGEEDGHLTLVEKDELAALREQDLQADPPGFTVEDDLRNVEALLAFFADRLKILLRDEGKRHDLVDAVFALGDDDLVRIAARVEALSEFLSSEDGANLLAGYRRATNILKAEVKKHPAEEASYTEAVDPARLSEPAERALHETLKNTLPEVEQQLGLEDFRGAMAALSRLRGPVDAFFDQVLVNDADPAVRLNRLRLLSQIRAAADRIADFSLIAG